MNEPVRADRPADHVESDLADLAEVRPAELRRYPTPGPSRRLLEETRRPRLGVMSGGGSNPGRAE
ncbi:aldo/keto reductase [Streptomyces sp. NPDC046716]|uniref:aldo/keto reductase n=1 Tax=Streptomyces sp. NPDC046716 TaxID=3157093 RepID=UPI0033C8D7A9